MSRSSYHQNTGFSFRKPYCLMILQQLIGFCSVRPPHEAKKLGYQVQGMANRKWLEEGYTICLEGVKAKITQNPNLMNMLRTTKPKLLAEAMTDRTWGTGIHLHNPEALDHTKWQSHSWLSSMLMSI